MSHPKSVEVESRVPDWAERMDIFSEKFDGFFNTNNCEKDNSKKRDYTV
jgi:hypothetical protein